MGRVLEKTKKPYEGIKFTRPLYIYIYITCVASKFHIILLLEEYPVLFKGQANIKDPMFKPSSLVRRGSLVRVWAIILRAHF